MYIFKEYDLDKNFSKTQISAVSRLINEVNSLQIVGIPNSGISIFVKYITGLPLGRFIYIDSYALSSVSKRDFWILLLNELGGEVTQEDSEEAILERIKELLLSAASNNERIIIVFNRFDQIHKLFDNDFFNTLRAIQRVSPGKIVMVFAVCKPIHVYSPEALEGANLGFFSNIFYLQPYRKEDMYRLYAKFGPEGFKKEVVEQAIKLSGGHYQLFQFLLKSDRIANPLEDQFVKLSIQDIYNRLSIPQQKELQKIAQLKEIGVVDEYLLKVGFVKQTEKGLELFSPLVREYIIRKSSRLPKKEARLLAILKKYKGSLVTKDMIFQAVWKDEADEMTDWALNSLVYRLKNNPAFVQSGFTIENYKRVGYLLTK
jgi:hypothetical protein